MIFVDMRSTQLEEEKLWQLVCSAPGAYLMCDIRNTGIVPWFRENGLLCLVLKPMDFRDIRFVERNAMQGEIGMKVIDGQYLVPLLQQMYDDGFSLYEVRTQEGFGILNTSHYLKRPVSMVDDQARVIREKMRRSVFYQNRYKRLDEKMAVSDFGDMMYSAWINTSVNALRAFGNGVLYAFTNLDDTHDGVTVYSQNAWNRVQGWIADDPDIEGKLTCGNDVDTAVIPRPGGFHLIMSKERGAYLPLFTRYASAMKMKGTTLAGKGNTCIVAVTYEDLKPMETKVNGLVVDMDSISFRINQRGFLTIGKHMERSGDIPVWTRIRTSRRTTDGSRRYNTAFAQSVSHEGSGVDVSHGDDGKWTLKISLEPERTWFLSVYLSEKGEAERFTLDRRSVSVQHYEFHDEAGIRKKLHKNGDEGRYLHEIFAAYLKQHTGNELLAVIREFIDEEYQDEQE